LVKVGALVNLSFISRTLGPARPRAAEAE
jgi:hypothetical protein